MAQSYRRSGSYLAGQIGAIPIVRGGAETLVKWQSEQLDRHAPLTVLNSRKVARNPSARRSSSVSFQPTRSTS